MLFSKGFGSENPFDPARIEAATDNMLPRLHSGETSSVRLFQHLVG